MDGSLHVRWRPQRASLAAHLLWATGCLVGACAASPSPPKPDAPPAATAPPADQVDEDGDGAAALVDCDDADPARFPGASEVCDGQDNDCDGSTREAGAENAQAVALLVGDGGTLVLCDSVEDRFAHRSGALTIEGNRHVVRGVEVTGGELVLRDLRVANAPGWGIEVNGGKLVVERARISGNAYGGVFVAGTASNPRVTLRDCEVTGHRGGAYGSGMVGNRVEVELERVEFSDNTADDAGAVYLGWSTLTARDVVMRDNSADGYGGAARFDDTAGTWEGGAIVGNRAGFGGGGLFLDGGALELEGLSIADNTSDVAGGGVSLVGGELGLDGCVIAGNVARFGGGIHAEDSVVRGSYTVLEQNASRDLFAGGGGGLLALRSVIDVAGFTVRGNTAQFAGGGLYLDESPFDGGGDSVVALNDARRGGGAYVRTSLDGSLAVEGAVVQANHADLGGGVYAETQRPSDGVELVGIDLRDNGANLGGGLLVAGSVTLTGGSALRNLATQSGGAIYVDVAGSVEALAVEMGAGADDNLPEDLRTYVGHGEGWTGTQSFFCTEWCTTL